MKKIFCLIAVLAVMVIFAGCQKETPKNQPAATTEPTAAAPAEPVGTLPQAAPEEVPSVQNGWQMEESGSLKAWKLTPAVWSSSNGATVKLSAQPSAYETGMGASFVVRLEGAEVENRSCDWNGSVFTAEVDLSAEDGYEFEMVLFKPQKPGEAVTPGERITLTDAYMNIANLRSSLEPACTLLVDDYKAEGESFDILAFFATVRLPQLNVGGASVTMDSAKMCLLLNGAEVESKTLELKPDSENAGSYTASGATISFKMPAMEDDYYLDLVLNVTLSNGETLSAQGGTWYYNNGSLSSMTAG